MKKTILLVILAIIGLCTANAQVGIGTITPDASAALDLTATDKGFLPPRLTSAQRNAITSPAEGLTIFNTDVNCVEFFQGSLWFNLCEGGLIPGPTSDCVSGFIPPFLTADETVVKDVTNPVTGDTWMDRNLGSYTADRSTPSNAGGTDCWAYGNLYQWGRNSDGHESRLLDCATADCFNAGGVNTTLPATPADVTNPTWAGKFIYNPIASPSDWHQANPDNTLWTNTGGTNNPCPAGYRVPTEAEWLAEWDSWDGTLNGSTPPSSNSNRRGAINSPLKLPVAGRRFLSSGSLNAVGNFGFYWSSTASSTTISRISALSFSSTTDMGEFNRATGMSIRCFKD